MSTVERRDWASLERDCLVNIFSRVELRDLIFYLPRVCKSWHNASFDPYCWKFLNLYTYFDEFSFYECDCAEVMEVLQLAVNRSRGCVVRLIFPSTGVNIQQLEYVSEKCPALEELSFPGLKEEEQKEIPKLICRWTNLKCLGLRALPSSFKEIFTAINQHCNKFVALGLGNWSPLLGLSFEKLVSDVTTSLPHLKFLKLHGHWMYKIELIKVMDICKDLELLMFQNVTLKGDQEEGLAGIGPNPLFSGVTDYRFEPAAFLNPRMTGLPIHRVLMPPNFFTLDGLGQYDRIDILMLKPKKRKVLKFEGSEHEYEEPAIGSWDADFSPTSD